MSEFPTQPTPEYTSPPPPPPTWEAPQRFRNGAGTSALVLGVLALILAILVVTSPLAAILGIIAIVLGIIGIGRAERGEAINRGSAIAGVVTGLLSLAVVAFLAFSIGRFTSNHASDFRTFATCMRDANTAADRDACMHQFSDRVNGQGQ
jgi:hypothetical protein